MVPPIFLAESRGPLPKLNEHNGVLISSHGDCGPCAGMPISVQIARGKSMREKNVVDIGLVAAVVGGSGSVDGGFCEASGGEGQGRGWRRQL